MAKQITKREENYSQWYNDIVKKAGLADNSAVRGCMVIKPLGYGIWENMKAQLDKMFKDTGHVNAYFPLFIPKSFLSREAQHVEGFAKECAVITHHRLMNDPDGNGVVVDPSARLEEELVVRPTSETIIWNTYKDWIQSYRDLPLLINQWANVVRWELRTRLFLRTAEFLWQEGHTVHATAEEAIEETKQMLHVYADFAENWLAMPVLCGEKTESERFPGAESTLCIEAMMQDRKALQAGTSHFLGQNFSKACGIKFQSVEGKEEFGWTTSWGVSTRLIGGMIMTHADDESLMRALLENVDDLREFLSGLRCVPGRAHRQGVAIERDGKAEQVDPTRVRGLEIGLLGPRAPRAHEHIHCAGTARAVVRLVAVHPGGGAGLEGCRHHQGVAVERDLIAEPVAAGLVARQQLGFQQSNQHQQDRHQHA